MFKDYYLILGIGKEATPEEIEKAFKDRDARFNGNLPSIELQEVKEAFAVLSNQETKILYDKELAIYNESDNFGNYEIRDKRLANIINSLQADSDKRQESSSSCGSKLGEGCIWVIIIIFIFFLQTCFKRFYWI